jgi:endoglucanase
MPSRRWLLACLLALASTTGVAAASEVAQNLAARMGPGINFGNMLDAPREGDWGLRVEDRFFALVGEGTPIRAVRLPVRWSNHASPDAQARIEPAFMARVAGVVDRLLARGVVVVLNMHHYRQLDGDALDPKEAAVPDDVVEARFVALWRQIAPRFAGHDACLVFEPYNEPHGRLNARWNDLLAQAVAAIRETNPTRVLLVGPTHWNAAHALSALRLPRDANLIVTIHHYEPFDFTHQGAAWVQPTRSTGAACCDAAQLQRMREPLDVAKRFAQERGYPVVVGEFGAYSAAATADRVRYLHAMRRLLDERQLPWFAWELASGFGFFDPTVGRWRPELHAALFGPRISSNTKPVQPQETR